MKKYIAMYTLPTEVTSKLLDLLGWQPIIGPILITSENQELILKKDNV